MIPGRPIGHRDMPTSKLDPRFSDPAANATPWSDVAAALEHAELYWLTTVRADGRPHVTPLVGVVHDGAAHFCTGLGSGLDVVVEGTAVRVTDRDVLQAFAKEPHGQTTYRF